MRFFDEDNKRFEWTFLFLIVVLVLYVGSFWLVRSNVSFPCESDGCSYQNVDFPTGAARLLYRPLIIWDKRLNKVQYSGEIDETKL